MASGGCRAKVSERRYSMKYFPFVVALTCTFVPPAPGVVAVGWLRKPFQLVGHSFWPLARVYGESVSERCYDIIVFSAV